ncbi:hypothetical protein ROZALSC1DRAFT_30954 [Rozella allomycis CSF55]|uniref:NYN domain-containing protein n=1 Tax=Rozella allomycis (strain CSF55) TaxID=988480 RepID=A0A4P9YDK3_ROZAC|nr:hypothetical protein ROZALSC1DRAFT_30954 [Rozella allomycis CSF55]
MKILVDYRFFNGFHPTQRDIFDILGDAKIYLQNITEVYIYHDQASSSSFENRDDQKFFVDMFHIFGSFSDAVALCIRFCREGDFCILSNDAQFLTILNEIKKGTNNFIVFISNKTYYTGLIRGHVVNKFYNGSLSTEMLVTVEPTEEDGEKIVENAERMNDTVKKTDNIKEEEKREGSHSPFQMFKNFTIHENQDDKNSGFEYRRFDFILVYTFVHKNKFGFNPRSCVCGPMGQYLKGRKVGELIGEYIDLKYLEEREDRSLRLGRKLRALLPFVSELCNVYKDVEEVNEERLTAAFEDFDFTIIQLKDSKEFIVKLKNLGLIEYSRASMMFKGKSFLEKNVDK